MATSTAKSKMFILAKWQSNNKQPFFKFLNRHCTNVTWNFLISCTPFMELRYGPFEFKCRTFCQHLKESDQEVWNSLSDVFFGMLSSRHFATMATWSNNFSSLFPSDLKKNYNSEGQKPTNMCLHGTCTLMINMVMKSTWK